MDHYDLSTTEALERLRANPGGRWSSGWETEPEDGTAWQRISGEPFFTPTRAPSFAIERDDRIFAIGSCFARGIEALLAGLGFAVESLTDGLDEFPVQGVGRPSDYTNRYNPESIFNDVRWAVSPDAEYPEAALQELPDGRWIDPHATYKLEFADRATTLRRRRILTDVTKRLPGCRILIITLGLVETFFDTRTGLYTNVPPWLTVEPDRFRFRVLTHDQCLDALERLHQLLQTHGHRDLQIVVTVSPVPLDSTFTGQDVVLANTFSKCVLRSVAGQWAASHENVHYFPSFEIVMNSDDAWHMDGRHVRNELVRHITELFVRTHLRQDQTEPTARRSA